jgi:hypothetical protein
MAYGHHWRRPPDLTPAAFAKAADDIREILAAVAERGVLIAGPTGIGKPEITSRCIAFNGARNCGHKYRNLGDPWPHADARGVMATNNVVVGPYYSGAKLITRVCGGNCAGDPFVVDLEYQKAEWSELDEGGYFCRCETLFKPFDLAVTAALIRLKQNLPDEFVITSDGRHCNGFEDAKLLCRELFGWADRFELDDLEEARVL